MGYVNAVLVSTHQVVFAWSAQTIASPVSMRFHVLAAESMYAATTLQPPIALVKAAI